MTKFVIAILFLSAFGLTHSLDNGLSLTPPMGWMHWERFRCLVDCDAYPDECISEKLFRDMADRLASDGYLDAGYEYIIIDDCWMNKTRGEDGKLVPDPKRFPSGIRNLSDYVHSKGLKFGIYEDFGVKTCAGYPGSLHHLETDANTFAEWGVDYLKLDACHTENADLEKGYIEMGQYLNKTGRPMVYSCSWPAYQEPLSIPSNYSLLAKTCNLWRNWDDIDDSWESVVKILKWFRENQARFTSHAGPGHWNDPDMLIIGNFGLSYEQSKAQMAIWAVLAAPLIMSVDLRSIEPRFRDILLNKELIGINQDPLGIQGKFEKAVAKHIYVYTRAITPVVEGAASYAIAFLSTRVDGYPYRANTTLSELNINEASIYKVTNIFDDTNDVYNITTKDTFFVRVKPSGVVLLKVTPILTGNAENSGEDAVHLRTNTPR